MIDYIHTSSTVKRKKLGNIQCENITCAVNFQIDRVLQSSDSASKTKQRWVRNLDRNRYLA